MRVYSSPPIVPSSQSPANTVADQAALTMTAPGSPSVNPVPDVMDHLPLPDASVSLPVNPQRDRITDNPAPGGMGPWAQPGFIDEGGLDSTGIWRET